MRIFTAIPIPNEVKNALVELTRGRLPIPYINITNLHITLNFLGDLFTDDSNKALKIFPTLVGEYRGKFEIEFDKIANFRQQIHLTVKNSETLFGLQQDLEAGFKTVGLHFQDQKFYPHVTLGKMHLDNIMNRSRKLVNFPNEELAQLNFTVQSVALFESKLLPHHAHHTPLVEVPLV
ncbi:MAG: RNA 2',3'-cyclic phosphodiesterase [Candidatus Doudnabacteria bacterium]|nr:RNA 2',3'-cyclic phosphodiesterase [Candidatus Doudnabacteria bacterium]